MSSLSWRGNDFVVEDNGEVHVLRHVNFHEEIGGGSFDLEAPIFSSEDGEVSNFAYSELIPDGSCSSLADARDCVVRSKATEILFVFWITTVGGRERANSSGAWHSGNGNYTDGNRDIRDWATEDYRSRRARDRCQSIVIAVSSFVVGAAFSLLLAAN